MTVADGSNEKEGASEDPKKNSEFGAFESAFKKVLKVSKGDVEWERLKEVEEKRV